jgi:hypothetical protein
MEFRDRLGLGTMNVQLSLAGLTRPDARDLLMQNVKAAADGVGLESDPVLGDKPRQVLMEKAQLLCAKLAQRQPAQMIGYRDGTRVFEGLRAALERLTMEGEDQGPCYDTDLDAVMKAPMFLSERERSTTQSHWPAIYLSAHACHWLGFRLAVGTSASIKLKACLLIEQMLERRALVGAARGAERALLETVKAGTTISEKILMENLRAMTTKGEQPTNVSIKGEQLFHEC